MAVNYRNWLFHKEKQSWSSPVKKTVLGPAWHQSLELSDVLKDHQQLQFAFLHRQTENQSDLFVLLSPNLNIVQASMNDSMWWQVGSGGQKKRFKTQTKMVPVGFIFWSLWQEMSLFHPCFFHPSVVCLRQSSFFESAFLNWALSGIDQLNVNKKTYFALLK